MGEHLYQDMLHLPYPNPEIEKDFPHRVLRAAQFAPFAALTGYEGAVAEVARLTEKRQEMDEDAKAELDEKIRRLESASAEDCVVTVTYFQPDGKKEGGRYLTYTGSVVAVKAFEKHILFADGTVVSLGEVTALEGDLFDEFYEEEGYEDL